MIKKKLPALAMILSLVLCGCAGGSTETVSSVTSVSEIPPASVSSVSSKEPDTRTGTDPVPETSVSETPDPEEYSVAEKILSEMTLEEKAAQMTIVAFDIFNEDVSACFSELKPGGVILFSKNFTSEEDLRKLTGELSDNSKRSGIPAFISIDQEGGSVQRIRFSGDYPKASEIGAGGDEAFAYDNGLKIGKELASYGINLDFAPVMDVNSNPNNPVIGNRSFSDNPETVSKMGIATMKGLSDAGVIPCLKHFPGHGDTDTDSHTGLPRVNKTLEELRKTELVPFKAGIDAGADMIMTAHIEFPMIETEKKQLSSGESITLPATLSYRILTELLREEMGFEGVIVTDALEMKAISANFGVLEATRYSVCAGADLMLIPVRIKGNSGIEEYRKYISGFADLIRSDAIPLERVNESVLRILKLKEKYGFFD